MSGSLSRFHVIPIFAILALFPACNQHLSGSGFLGTYLDMKPGRALDAESHLPGLRFDGRASLVVQAVRPYLLVSGSDASVQRLADVFQTALVRQIGGTALYGKVIESHSLMPPVGTTYALDAVITEIETGLSEASLRPGGGIAMARRISVEGKITEITTGRPVFKFKDSREEAPRARRAGADVETEARLEKDLERIAGDVADSLRAIHADSRKAPSPSGNGGGNRGEAGDPGAHARR